MKITMETAALKRIRSNVYNFFRRILFCESDVFIINRLEVFFLAYWFQQGIRVIKAIVIDFFSVFEWANLRSEEHTSELQSRFDLVCRLLLEKKNKTVNSTYFVVQV